MKRIIPIALIVVALAGGAASADDRVWLQQKQVSIASSNFQECVANAVTGVDGVKVNRATSSSADKVPLEVSLSRPIPFLSAEVQHRNDNTAVIVFSGRGASEPQADRLEISPVLDSVANAVSTSCGNKA